MTKQYYAVCDANGRVSVALEAETVGDAVREIRAMCEAGDLRAAVDDAQDDIAEDEASDVYGAQVVDGWELHA